MRIGFLFIATKTRRHKRILLIWVCGLAITAYGQDPPKKIKEFPIGEVSKVALDRLGDFYLVLKGGKINKYDTEGNLILEFANPEIQTVTLLEPWNPLRIFIYSKEKQEIFLLDHHLEILQKITVDPVWAVEPCLATTSLDNNLWIVDKSDASLKRIDPKTGAPLLDVTLRSEDGKNSEFIYLREYQNLLFLVDRKSGVLILSSIGKLVHKIVAPNIEYIGFLGEEFYYLENAKLKFFDLYTEERREISVDPSARFVLVTDERMVLVKQTAVEIWEFKP